MSRLIAFLDMDHTAASYDAVTWLVHARFIAQEKDCEHLHVVIVPNSKTGFCREWGKHDAAATEWRFWHIVVAAMPLARATVTVAPTRNFACRIAELSQFDGEEIWWPKEKAHFLGPLVQASRAGKTIPKLRATDAARRYVAQWFDPADKVVTFTLRNQETDSDRNSNISAMSGIHNRLISDYEVVWLDDTNRALSESVVDAPILDIDLRLALYERASMNVLSNNGVQELCKFSDAPYLAFGQALTDGWRDHWRKYFSLEPGQQLPWSRSDQCLIYAPDSFENLCSEFEKWEARNRDR